MSARTSSKSKFRLSSIFSQPVSQTKSMMRNMPAAAATTRPRLAMACRTKGRKRSSRKWAKPASKRCRNRLGGRRAARSKACRKWPGRIRKHSIKEAAITTSMTKAISFTGASSAIIKGEKAHSVVSEDATTGASMRAAPPRAASAGDLPASNWVSDSSPTTMASSTTMPSAITQPIRLMALIVPPSQ